MNTPQKRYQGGYVERRGNVWYLQFREGAEKRRTRIGTIKDFPTKGAAERAALGIRERINDPQQAVAPKTMADVAARYIVEEMPQRPSTAKNYRHYLHNHILPKWGERPVQGIKAHEVRTWIRAVGMSSKTRAHIHGLMRILFRFAMLWEWYPQGENPMRLFKLEDSSKRVKKPRVLTPDEFGRLLVELAEPYRSMAMICGGMGLRCSELFGLQWRDVDWIRKTVTVSRAVVGRHIGDVKTEHSRKPLPVADELMELFARIRRTADCPDPDAWVFPSSQQGGKRPYNPYAIQRYQLSRAAQRIGLGEVGWHTLRHSYRSWLDQLGAPVGVQRDLMRHSDIRTTMNVYGDSFIENLREAQGNIAKMVLQ